MASEPSRWSDVGKRTSWTSKAVKRAITGDTVLHGSRYDTYAVDVGGSSPGVCLRRASLADPAPIVDVEDVVQPFRSCFIQIQFGSPIEPGKLIDGPNADNCGSDRRVLEDPGGRDDVLGFPKVATKLGEVSELAVLGSDPDPVLRLHLTGPASVEGLGLARQ